MFHMHKKPVHYLLFQSQCLLMGFAKPALPEPCDNSRAFSPGLEEVQLSIGEVVM